MRVLRWPGGSVLAAVALLWASLGVAPNVAAASAPAQQAPPAVKAGVVIKSATTGFIHTCALSTTGAVLCWGYNGDGELGNGTTTDSAKPLPVSGLKRGVRAISAGSYFTCALTAKRAVKCWGSNSYGQLGNNTTTNSAKPVPVYGLDKGVVSINAGSSFACALTEKGAVKCWGANTYGQLGNNSTTSSAKPVAVKGFAKGGLGLGLGGYHGCAITSKHGAKCWGYNAEGELGDNSKVDSLTPVAVYGLDKGVRALRGGSYTTCALTTKDAVKCWGYNGDGELGDGTTTGSPKPVAAYRLNKNIEAIAYGDIHGCALNTKGIVKCWGYNGYGALGDNSTVTSSKPVTVYNMGATIDSITAGGYHSCAVTTKGAVKCWGFNTYGELGDGTTVTSHKPVKVVGLT